MSATHSFRARRLQAHRDEETHSQTQTAIDATSSRQPERRRGQDPWQQRGRVLRPRRVSDDLAWLRVAFSDPEPHGLHPLSHGGAVAAWVPDDDAVERLRRLRDRALLEAAGFRLFENEAAHA